MPKSCKEKKIIKKEPCCNGEVCSSPTPVTSTPFVLTGLTTDVRLLLPLYTFITGTTDIVGISFSGGCLNLIAPVGAETPIPTGASICCTGGTVTVTPLSDPGVPSILPAGTLNVVDLLNVFIAGAVEGTIRSSCPVVSNTSVPTSTTTGCGSVVVSGNLNQTLSFTAVSAPTDELLLAIANFLLGTTGNAILSALFTCFGGTLIADLPVLLQDIITSLFDQLGLGVVPATLSAALTAILTAPAVISAVIDSITPIVQALLANLCVSVDFPVIPFNIPIVNECLIPKKCSKKPPIVAPSSVTATIAAITPVPATVNPLLPVTVVVGGTIPVAGVTLGAILTALGVTVTVPTTTLSAPFTVTIAPGITVAVDPAVTKTDVVTACVSILPKTCKDFF